MMREAYRNNRELYMGIARILGGRRRVGGWVQVVGQDIEGPGDESINVKN